MPLQAPTDPAPADITYLVVHNGERIDINVGDFDGNDARDYAAVTGSRLADLARGAPLDLHHVEAILWIHYRREQPDLTYEQVTYTVGQHRQTVAARLDAVKEFWEGKANETGTGTSSPKPVEDASPSTPAGQSNDDET